MSCVTIALFLAAASFLIVVSLTVPSEGGSFKCPPMCQCSSFKGTSDKADSKSDSTAGSPRGKQYYRRVACKNLSPSFPNITRSFVTSLPNRTKELDLSGNEFTYLESNTFDGLTTLSKLNLSGNPILRIQPQSFRGLVNLESLDLSGTKLTVLDALMLGGMPKLKRLRLVGTTIQTIHSDTFNAVPALVKLELQTEVLVCNCNLRWIIAWIQEKKVRLNDNAACAFPSSLQGKLLKDLADEDIHCDSPLELPIFELIPSTNQIVFSGDKLPLSCRASPVDDNMTMSWRHDDVLMENNQTLGIFVITHRYQDQKQLQTTVAIQHLSVAHSGTWTCVIESDRGNITKSVSVVVLDENTRYCSPLETRTSRGRYAWARTLAGVVQVLPCDGLPSVAVSGQPKPVARHTCSLSGLWADLDVSNCPYESETTRDLDARLRNITNRRCKGADCSKQIVNIAESTRMFSTVEDVIILSHIIGNLSRNFRNDNISRAVISLTSSVMDLPSELLAAAQRQDQACSKIVRSVEEMTDNLLLSKASVKLNSKNVAVMGFKMQPYQFEGINCTNWVGPNRTANEHHNFDCTWSGVERDVTSPQVFDASIAIPTDILTQIRCASTDCPQNDTIRIQAIYYRNAKLFPVSKDPTKFQVTSSVIASRIAGARVVNSSSQIIVHIASPKAESRKIPVHWDFSASEKHGAWLTTGCVLGSDALPIVTFKCNHLTNFAVAEGQLPPPTDFEVWLISCNGTSVITYLGSAVLVVCLLTVCVVFILHRREIQMSRKMRHAIVNLCLCLVLLCVAYTLGIRVHQLSTPCRVVGLAIHYLSLCTLFWIAAISFKMLHHLSKQEATQPPPEELSGEPPKSKPIIAGYLLGWGVAIIICGISGAINWANYELPGKYCFLSMEAALMTVFVPAAILGFFNLVLFLRIFCLIRRIPSAAQSLPATKSSSADRDLEETPENEIQLLTSNQTSGTDTTPGSNRSSSPLASDSSPVDRAYGPGSQLCALILILVLYCSMWTAGAFAVTLPLPHHDIVFQCLYAVLASAFGAFMVIFYCIGRRDVRTSCCVKIPVPNKWNYVQTNGNSLSKHPVEAPLVLKDPVLADNVSLAASQSVHSNGVDASLVSSNVPIARPPAAEPAFTSVVDGSLFYNPHQNGVAKKYWERIKRKRAMQLQKGVGGASTDEIEQRNRMGNGSAMTGQAAGTVPEDFTAELEMRDIEPTGGGGRRENLPPPLGNEIQGYVQKPSLPILSPLLSSESPGNRSEYEKSQTSRPDSVTKIDGSVANQNNKVLSMPNGFKQPWSKSGGDANLNRVRDSGGHERTENDDFLEQLELRVPPQQANHVKSLPPTSVLTAQDKKNPSFNNDNVRPVTHGKKSSAAVISKSNKQYDDLNGNKDSRALNEKHSGMSNSDADSQRALLRTGSSVCHNYKEAPGTSSELESSSVSEEGALDVWEEQRKTDLKVESSV